MKDLSQSFNKMLEQYVFATVNQVIDLADTEQQAALVKLIIDIPADAVSPTTPQLPVTRSTNGDSEPRPDQSLADRRVHTQWLADLFQRQLDRNQASIAQLEQAIESTQLGFQSRVSEYKSEMAQATMAMWHTRVIDQYQRYMLTLQAMQQHNRDRLSRLVSQ